MSGLAESRPDLLLGVIVKHASASKKLQQAAAAAAAAKSGSSAKGAGVMLKKNVISGLEVKPRVGATVQSDSLLLANDSMDISPQDKVGRIQY